MALTTGEVEDEDVTPSTVINCWSGPRCLSTSLMYSFAQRSDSRVLDEPLYAHFLRLTGASRPYRDLVLVTQNADGDAVVASQILGASDKKVVYAKHMAKQRIGLGTDIMQRCQHVLLIREPRLLIPSFAKVAPPTLDETCLPALCALYSEIKTLRGRPPPVIVSEDLQRNPEGTLRALCGAFRLPWDPRMLEWAPGPRPEDGVWAPWWYATTHTSSGFAPPPPSLPAPLTPEQYALVEDCHPFYNLLLKNALTPLVDPDRPLHPPRADQRAYSSHPEDASHLTNPAKRTKSGTSASGGNITKQTEEVGTHKYLGDQRNSRIFVGVRDGVSGRFCLVPRAEAKVSVLDSGYLLGDGMWEGVRLHKGRLVFQAPHLERLFENLKAIDMHLGLDMRQLAELVYRTTQANGMHSGVHIRLMVTRGLKPTPYQNPNTTLGAPTVVIIPEHKHPSPLPAQRGIRLHTCHIRRGAPDVQDPGWNSHSKLNCIAACIQANMVGVEESLMLDPLGFVATCNSVNFFVARKGEVWAPTTKYQMAGITRGAVLKLCQQNAIPARECDFYLTQVYGADEAFVTGTFGGVIPVIQVDGRQIGGGRRGPICERLQKLYSAMVDADVEAADRADARDNNAINVQLLSQHHVAEQHQTP